jgi:hypothetical protein
MKGITLKISNINSHDGILRRKISRLYVARLLEDKEIDKSNVREHSSMRIYVSELFRLKVSTINLNPKI